LHTLSEAELTRNKRIHPKNVLFSE